MQAEIIIEHGQARLLRPVYLKTNAPTHINIEIPDEYIAPTREWFPSKVLIPAVQQSIPAAKSGSLQDELNTILGSLAKTRPNSSIGDDHQILLDALEEKYFGR